MQPMEEAHDPSFPFSAWRPLLPSETAGVPTCPGVFELATLVRTVVLIGAANESLMATLDRFTASPAPVTSKCGRLYFRYRPCESPAEIQERLLDEHRQRHGGALPPAQEPALHDATPPERHLKAV